MSENKSIFKLKKASRIIGGIDINDNQEWVLLRKEESMDLPSFIHFHKLWCEEEIPDEYDTKGNIIEKGRAPRSRYVFYKGFIKDDKFIVTRNDEVTRADNNEIIKSYISSISAYTETGYIKDNITITETPPIYYINEKSSMAPTSNEISKMAGSLGAALSSNTSNTSSTPNVIISNIIKSIKSKI